MGARAHEVVTDSPKAEVGEIDTRAPFESVKAAVSLFGEVAVSGDKSTARKPKPQSTEIWQQKPLAKERELHLAQKELNRLKQQLHNAETTRTQALAELDRARKTADELTYELKAINESKESALKVTEAAKGQTEQLEEVISSDGSGKDGAWKQELDSAKEQHAVALTELDAAKQDLRMIRMDFEASIDSKISAYQQEAEAMQSSDANTEKAAQLTEEIAAALESLIHVKLATGQAQQEESKICSEKDARLQSYRLALEETEKKLAFLNKDFDPELSKNLEVKLAETATEVGAIQKKLEDARISELEFATSVTTELDGAKEVLQKVADEDSYLKSLVESLKLDLEAVKKEHSQLKEKDIEIESIAGNLQVQLQNCKAEHEAVMASESKASSASDDLTSTLQQLSAESEAAFHEAEAMKRNAEELRHEAEAARMTLAETEEKLHVALSVAEEAKAAEIRALNQIKELSEKATISAEEYNSLTRKVEESEKLAEMKVAFAMAQVKAVRAGENEAVKRLETARKEMEDMSMATKEALERAEMAEKAKKAVEGELRKWREREQKKAAEVASQILAETTRMSSEQSPPRAGGPMMNTTEKSGIAVTRKAFLPSLVGIFQRRKSQAEGRTPSYLPGEKPV